MNIEYKILNNYRKEKGELEGVKAERRRVGEEENKKRVKEEGKTNARLMAHVSALDN